VFLAEALKFLTASEDNFKAYAAFSASSLAALNLIFKDSTDAAAGSF
jgi:hypothetical protein